MEQEIRPAHALVSDRDGESASTEVLSWILDAPTGGPLPVPRLSNRACVAVACADGQGSALTNDGSVYVWGSNDDGALLADEAAAVVTVPSAVDTLAGSGAAALSCGGHHVGVVTNGGVALTFGSNEYAALGHSADRAFRVPPRAVQGLGAVRVAQVACGPTHTVILGRGGEVFTAGSGLLGALGRGEADQSPAPRRVEALTGVPVGAVAAGDNYSCALTVTVRGVPLRSAHRRCGTPPLPSPIVGSCVLVGQKQGWAARTRDPRGRTQRRLVLSWCRGNGLQPGSCRGTARAC